MDKPPPYAPGTMPPEQPPPPPGTQPPPPYSVDPKAAMYPSNTASPHIPPQYPPTYQVNPPPMQGYGSTTYVQTQAPCSVPAGQVIVIGACPACRVGFLEDDFTLCGVLCAIFFFPLGILCCLAMRERRCSNCGAIYG